MQCDAVDMAFVFDTPSPLIMESDFYEPLRQERQWRVEILLEALHLVGLEGIQLLQAGSETIQENTLFTNIEITSEVIVPRNTRKRINTRGVEIPKAKTPETEAQRYYRELQEKEEREREEKLNAKSK